MTTIATIITTAMTQIWINRNRNCYCKMYLMISEDNKESEIEKLIWGKNVPEGFKYSEEQESGKIGLPKRRPRNDRRNNRDDHR
jgi:hypothetical protein